MIATREDRIEMALSLYKQGKSPNFCDRQCGLKTGTTRQESKTRGVYNRFRKHSGRQRHIHPGRQCAVCLYSVGFGCKVIGRLIDAPHNLVCRWIKSAGVFDPQRSKNADRRRKARALFAPPVKDENKWAVSKGLACWIKSRPKVSDCKRAERKKQRLARIERAIEMYRSGICATKCDKANGLQYGETKKHATAAGIYSRTKSKHRDAFQAAVKLFKTGETISQISSKLGVSYANVYFWVSREGLIAKRPKPTDEERIAKRFYRKMVHGLRRRLRQAIADRENCSSLIGCAPTELRRHIQSQFAKGMSWDNYGDWHVDHIIPCASFDLSDKKQQKLCFHFSNLRPLWAKDNIAKSDKMPDNPQLGLLLNA